MKKEYKKLCERQKRQENERWERIEEVRLEEQDCEQGEKEMEGCKQGYKNGRVRKAFQEPIREVEVRKL